MSLRTLKMAKDVLVYLGMAKDGWGLLGIEGVARDGHGTLWMAWDGRG